ncbi:MAG: response regulator transcription factor [Gammaproteobacteria bacterium]|nr:response regulator transcription factor [Gammaproteobacteria bacterium]
MRLLLVEDDRLLGEGIEMGLKQQAYIVDWLEDGEAAILGILHEDYDAVVLDIGLPKKNGIEVLKEIRRKGRTVPVLILTALDAIEDRVAGLDAGADDYLTKPFDLNELYARIRALIRRSSGRAEAKIIHGELELDPASHQVSLSGKPVELSRREYTVLLELMENRGRVMSRRQLEQGLYGLGEEVESNAVEVHVHHIRKKIASKLIRTVRGVGYIIEKDV